MKSLSRAWTLTLDFLMLVLLLAAPGSTAQRSSSISRRDERAAFVPDDSSFLTPSPVYVRVEPRRARRQDSLR